MRQNKFLGTVGHMSFAGDTYVSMRFTTRQTKPSPPMRQLFLLLATAALSAAQAPPAGFTALFNGSDLTGWRGGDTADHRRLLAMPGKQRAELLKTWTADMRQHWQVMDGELHNDGNGKYATTTEDYGDFELLVDYNMAPLGDSGIYLRNVPQVQIWDHNNENEWKNGARKGSGGLWNNSPGAPGKDPLVLADKPAGEWNSLRVVMVGARVSVWLNGQLTVDHAILENYYDRKVSIPSKGPLCLQTHGAPIKWRHLYIREITGTEANKLLATKASAGFKSIFNGFVILDADLSKVDTATVMGNSAHPGKDRSHGFFGFAGHNDPVEFRAISIRNVEAKK